MRIRYCLAVTAALCLSQSPALAADMFSGGGSPYNPTSFNFDGFYIGAQGGGIFGNSREALSLGVVAGANFSLSDPVIAGFELQTDALLRSGGTQMDIYGLGRVGMVVTSDFMAYAEAGPGWSRGNFGYAIGAGGEYALSDVLSVKGEVQGLGDWGNGPQATRVQGGLLFHMQ